MSMSEKPDWFAEYEKKNDEQHSGLAQPRRSAQHGAARPHHPMTLAAPAQQMPYNAWAEPLYLPHGQSPYDYMLCAMAVVASGKTYEVSRALVVKGAPAASSHSLCGA